MSKEWSPSVNHIFVVPCSGPCNVGLLAHQAAVELTREGSATMLNLAGIAGHRSTFVEGARELMNRMVVLDGCSVKCAGTTLRHVGFDVETHVVVTDLGIQKSDDLNFREEDVITVKNVLKDLAPRVAAGLPPEKPKCLCTEEW